MDYAEVWKTLQPRILKLLCGSNVSYNNSSLDTSEFYESYPEKIDDNNEDKDVILESIQTDLLNLLQSTINKGEGNSVLISGPRGCGKTTLIKSTLSKILNNTDTNQFLTVYLSGHFHLDDKVALKDIVRQLKSSSKNTNLNNNGQYNEDYEDEDFNIDLEGSSFANTLTNLLRYVQSGNSENIPILFILEEFDLFAQHSKQMLLYNLLDMSQTPGIPVCIIGTTCRVDCLDLLEKRVKSRFSHRQILLTLPNTFDDYVNIISKSLKLSNDYINENKIDNFFADVYNQIIDVYFIKDQNVTQFLLAEYDLSKSIRRAFLQLYKGLRNFDLTFPSDINFKDPSYYDPNHEKYNENVQNTINYIIENNNLLLKSFWDNTRRVYKQAESYGIKQLLSLSQLELVLLAAIFHFYSLELEQFNFEMTYDKYKELIIRHSKQNDMLFIRPVALRSFEQLQNINAIHPVEVNSTKSPREYIMYRLACYPFQIEQALRSSDMAWALSL